MESSFSLLLDDGVLDDDDSTFSFQGPPDLYEDPDFKSCGDSLSWKGALPKNYIVMVRTNDNGYKPHFHVVDSNTKGEKFSSCIRIDVPEYFRHGHYQNVLNGRDLDALVTFLKQISPHDEQKRTNWRRIVDEWNRNSERSRVQCVNMPDYQCLMS